KKLRLPLSWCGGRTELLSQVRNEPGLLNLIVHKVKEGDCRPGHLFASRGDSHEIPFLRAVSGIAHRYFVSVGYQVLNCEAEIGEGGVECSNALPAAFRPPCLGK